MKYFGKRAVLGFSFALISTAAYSAQKTCASLLQMQDIVARQLYVLPSGSPLEPVKSLKRQSPPSLAYIVPSHAYNSGVVILKVRHHLVAPAPATTPQRITLSRIAYRTPCNGKPDVQTPEATYEPDVTQYVNYHKYQLPDPLMDRVHADLGNRPKGWWGESDNRCVSTSSWDIRPQLQFEDSITDRQVIGVVGYFGNRVTTAFQAPQTTGTAVAASPAYSAYRDLAVRVLPYRKSPDRFSCINIPISTAPAGTDWTDVMIIDADDARYPRDTLLDPQKTWRIQWN